MPKVKARKSRAPAADLRVDAMRALGALKNKPFFGFEEQKGNLQALVRATVSSGESNSVVVVGPRGTGKTAFVHDVLSSVEGDAILVRLNGLLQTDDRLALKRITNQLRMEDEVGEKTFNSFAEHLDFLLSRLSAAKSSKKHRQAAVIFVLEEFDLFCDHHNQTLLYNLFDVAQAADKVPLLVIGVTARIDFVEIMEKRVQSRFSRRSIHLNKPASFMQYLDFVRHFLVDEKKDSTRWVNFVEEEVLSYREFFQMLFNKNPLLAFLKQLTYLVLLNSIKDFGIVSLKHWQQALTDQTQDMEQSPILSLTILDLSLLVACIQLDENETVFNFEMAFSAFHRFVSRKCSILRYGRDVMLKCWENLIHLELLRHVDKSLQKEYRPCVLNVSTAEVKRAVSTHGDVYDAVKQWAKAGDLPA